MRGKQSEFGDILQQVMENPDQWARIKVGESRSIHNKAQGLRAQARKDHLPGQKEGEWDIKVRKLESGDESETGLFVMYKRKAG